MTTTYNLAPQPNWREFYPMSYPVVGGTPLVGGKIYTYEIDMNTPKPTWQDSAGGVLNTNPIILDQNGQAIIYWAFDDTDATDLYYIEVKDSNDNLIYARNHFDAQNFSIAQTSDVIIEANAARNSQFAGAHYGTAKTISAQTAECYLLDEWYMRKSNGSAVEVVTQATYGLAENVPFNPRYGMFINTTTAGNESFKYYYQKYTSVKTFAGQQIAWQFRGSSTLSSQYKIYVFQFFGTGGSPSSTVQTFGQTVTLSPTTTLYSGTINVPLIAGGSTVGSNGDDAVWFLIEPASYSIPCNITFTNFALNVTTGGLIPTYEWVPINTQLAGEDYEIFKCPTGTVRAAYSSTAPEGWLLMNDASIGRNGSGATGLASENARALYYWLYVNCANAQCPVSTGRTAPGNTIAAATTDFNAGKTLTMPLTMGRMLMNAGAGAGLTARVNGVTGGAESTQLTSGQMAQHFHATTTNTNGNFTNAALGGAGTNYAIDTNNAWNSNGGTTLSGAGSSLTNPATTPVDLMNPFTASYWIIKL